MLKYAKEIGSVQFGGFWQSLHPVSLFFYMALIMSVAVIISHPFLIAALFMATFFAVVTAGGIKAWVSSLKIFGSMIIVLAVINILVNPAGITIIVYGPVIPGFGPVNFTFENLMFSLVAGARLLIIYSLFIFFNRAMDTDRCLTFFARFLPRFAIMIAMAAKTIPDLAGRLQRIRDTQRIRGVYMSGRGRLAAIKDYLPIVKILIISALEDSFNMGESIQARAYGSGPRTSLYENKFSRGDFLMLLFSGGATVCLTMALYQGWAFISFFPYIDMPKIVSGQVVTVILSAVLLTFPAFFSWGWQRWDYLRWKI